MKGAAILIVAACLALAACAGERTAADSERSQVVYVVRRGWHTGVAVASADWPRGSPLLATFSEARYLEFGWGDAEFYQAEQPTSSMAIAAVLWPSSTVMEVVPLEAAPPPGAPDFEAVALHVTKAELQAVVASLEDSFVQPISPTGKTYRTAGGEARFFHARGKFHLFRMCNRWTSEILQRAGCAGSPRLTMTASRVIKTAKRCDAESAGAGR